MPGIIVKAQVTALVRQLSKEMKLPVNNVTSDYMPALDKKVRKIVEESVMRANENKRKTLMGRDV
ncbi:hypothetical protein HYY74_06180 [Candidatus Woesearchaeota archaeon]|nr:hypothetical protein [Candidatus Woesearchaeota archaeon]